MISLNVAEHSARPLEPKAIVLAGAGVTALWLILSVLVAFLRRREVFSGLPGPPSRSWIFGNTREIMLGEFGLNARRWIDEYGPVFRVKACFGEDRLMVSDPKTLQAIITDVYSFPRALEHYHLGVMLFGKGLLSVEGDVHKKQRQLLAPAFGPNSIKAFYPTFLSTARTMVQEWMSICMDPRNNIGTEKNPSAIIDVYHWMHRASLDSLGKCNFDHDFRSLYEDEDPAAKGYHGLLKEFLGRSPVSIISEQSLRYLPGPIINFTYLLPAPIMKKISVYRKLMHELAKQLIENSTNVVKNGSEKTKSLISQLTKLNLALESGATNISLEEIYDQFITFMIAGGEAGALSVTWSLYHVSKNPVFQSKLRQEISKVYEEVRERGDEEFSISDYDKMTYLMAFIKEVFRFYASAPLALREANRDLMLPISKPFKTKLGETRQEFEIKKGQVVIINAEGYNRLESVWGPDAKVFDPDRWLDGRTDNQVPSGGLYGNMMTFYGGGRGCIGWRFAVVHMQVVLVELMRSFHFAMPEGQKISRDPLWWIDAIRRRNDG